MKTRKKLQYFITGFFSVVAFIFILQYLPKQTVFAWPTATGCGRDGSISRYDYGYGCWPCGGSGCSWVNETVTVGDKSVSAQYNSDRYDGAVGLFMLLEKLK